MKRFNMPSDKDLIEMIIVFNEPSVNIQSFTNTLAAFKLVLDRLQENGSIKKPSSKEINNQNK